MAAFALFGLSMFFLGQCAANDLELPRQRYRDEVAAIDDLRNRSVSGFCQATGDPKSSKQPSCSEVSTTYLDNRHQIRCTISVWVEVNSTFDPAPSCADTGSLNQSVVVEATAPSMDEAEQLARDACPNQSSRLMSLLAAGHRFPCFCDSLDNSTLYAELPEYPQHPDLTKGIVGTVVSGTLAAAIPVISAIVIWRLVSRYRAQSHDY